MSVLAYQQLRHLVLGDPPLVEGYADLDAQLQPNGMDLTLDAVARFTGAARIGRTNAERQLAPTTPVPLEQREPVWLEPGPYLITLAETVRLPGDVMAVAKPRSSLLRSGVAVHNAVWDAGYHGRSQALLVVSNPQGFWVSRRARVLQIVFCRLDAPTEATYTGRYQGEHL